MRYRRSVRPTVEGPDASRAQRLETDRIAFTYPEQGAALRSLLAAFVDWCALTGLLAAAAVVVLPWVLWRTEWGRVDVSAPDVAFVAAFVGAIVPAWAVWQAGCLYESGATIGQGVAGLEVRGLPKRRAARFLGGPVATPV